jgi:hypothetical protein
MRSLASLRFANADSRCAAAAESPRLFRRCRAAPSTWINEGAASKRVAQILPRRAAIAAHPLERTQILMRLCICSDQDQCGAKLALGFIRPVADSVLRHCAVVACNRSGRPLATPECEATGASNARMYVCLRRSVLSTISLRVLPHGAECAACQHDSTSSREPEFGPKRPGTEAIASRRARWCSIKSCFLPRSSGQKVNRPPSCICAHHWHR